MQHGLAQQAEKERWTSAESDHSKVSQFTIGRLLAQHGMKRTHAQAWATAIGAHHGSIHGYSERGLQMPDDAWEKERAALVAELEKHFGPLAAPTFAPTDPRLWAIAGLISVADWIGSDERWFPPERDLSVEESRAQAEQAVATLGMCVRHIQPGFEFDALFGFPPNSLQCAVLDVVKKPGIYILEAPMGMGKTEAALAAAYRLLAERSASGVYFALPTQATSNRIHARMGPFIERISGGEHGVRLIHSMSWLRENLYIPTLRPSRAYPPSSDFTSRRSPIELRKQPKPRIICSDFTSRRSPIERGRNEAMKQTSSDFTSRRSPIERKRVRRVPCSCSDFTSRRSPIEPGSIPPS